MNTKSEEDNEQKNNLNKVSLIIALVLLAVILIMAFIGTFIMGRSTVTVTSKETTHYIETTSYEIKKADKHIVAEIKSIFRDTIPIDRYWEKGPFWSTRHIVYQIKLAALYKYYIDFTNFELEENNGLVYAYVNPLIFDEPVGWYDYSEEKIKDKGTYIIPEEEIQKELNDFRKADGPLQKKLTEEGKSKFNEAQLVAKESIAEIMVNQIIPLIGDINIKDPSRVIVKFERHPQKRVIKLEGVTLKSPNSTENKMIESPKSTDLPSEELKLEFDPNSVTL